MEKQKRVMMIWLIWGVGLAVVVLGSPPENSMSCEQALSILSPCQPFLKGAAGADLPSLQCCSGVRIVFLAASSTKIRKDFCVCFKKAAPQIGVIPDRAKQIPTLCKIPLNIPIDPNTDCSKIP